MLKQQAAGAGVVRQDLHFQGLFRQQFLDHLRKISFYKPFPRTQVKNKKESHIQYLFKSKTRKEALEYCPILKNGGVYESTVYEAERDRYLERYWIDLSDRQL